MSRVLLGFTFTLVLSVSAVGLAQDGPPRFLQVTTVTVAPGMSAQFLEVVRQVNEAYVQTGAEPQGLFGYATAMGGSGTTYYFVTPFQNWSDVDGWRLIPDVLVEAYGQEEAARILSAADASLLTRETSTAALQTNFSSQAADTPDELPRFVQVISTQVDPGRLEDYFLFLAELKEAEDAAGVSTTRRGTVLGQVGFLTATRFFNDFAERDSWRGALALLNDHLGAAEADPLIQRQQEAVLSREIQVLVFRSDLSRSISAP